MNYELEIQKSTPAVFENFAGELPPLVAGAGTASLRTSEYTVSFLAFSGDSKDQPFTLEVWHLPTENGLIIGHTDEGLFYENGDYILRMNFATAPVLEGRWHAPDEKARHLVVTYDASRYSLYVDGVNVIALDVPNDELASSGEPIITGLGIYDSLALYYKVLTANDIKVHFSWGREASTFVDIASSKGAGTYTLSFEDVDVFDVINLSPTFETDTWQDMIPLGSMQTTTPGVYVSWFGHDVEFSYSIDNISWTVIENRSTILEDENMLNKVLFLQAKLLTDDAVLDSVSLYLLADRIMEPFSGIRELTFKSVSMDETPGHQLEYQSDQGATIRGGYIQIESDGSGVHAHSVRTIEAWIKSTVPVNINATVDTIYRNGVVDNTFNGTWAHYVFVLSSATNNPIRIGDGQDLNIGTIAVYSDALSASKVSQLYNLNIGGAAIRINDSGKVNVSESNPVTDIYAYSWSIVSG